jgi:hypothetical protein
MRHPGPQSAPVTLESLFAVTGGDPLATAFPGKRGVHVFANSRAAPETEVEPLWHRLHAQPRQRRAVAYVHVS